MQLDTAITNLQDEPDSHHDRLSLLELVGHPFLSSATRSSHGIADPANDLTDMPKETELNCKSSSADAIRSGFEVVPSSGTERSGALLSQADLGSAVQLGGLTLGADSNSKETSYRGRLLSSAITAFTFGTTGLAAKGVLTNAEMGLKIPFGHHFPIEKAAPLFAINDDKAEAHALTAPKLTASENQLLDEIEKSHFEYFRQESDRETGLTKDRSKEASMSSIAAVGFSLTAHPVAVSRGYISREEAIDYTLKVLKNLSSTPQGDQTTGVSGNHGFFYHFLDPKTGLRAGTNELSTIDTGLLMGGVLFCKNYYDGNSPKEAQIRELADNLYKRVDWAWALNSEGRLSMGWTPEKGFIKSDWHGYNEAQILLLLAIGSPTHPLDGSAWNKYMSTSTVVEMNGQKSLEFGPLFGHQYSQIWTDYRGIKDATNQKLGFNYFENSRRAAIAQHEYAITNPMKWKGYGALDWGLTACDGPGRVVKVVDGKSVEFKAYKARGFPNSFDDGTIAPTAVAASLPFAPELVMPTLKHWYADRPEILGPLGFQDAFNPTFDPSKPSGWVDKDTIGIDQGPILLMTENYRSGFVWNSMKNDQYLNSAYKKAGFTPDQSQPKTIGKITLLKDWQLR